MINYKRTYNKRKPRIAIVDNSTWNIYNFRLSLIKRLRAEGFEVIVIAPVDEYIHYLNDSHFNKHIELKNLSPQGRSVGRDLLLIKELYDIYRQEQPDLIIHYTIKPNIFGNIAARLAGIASIATITGLGYTFLHQSLVHRMVPFLYRFAFQKTRKVVFYNPDDQQIFIKKELIPAEKGIVIPGSGVNTNHFRPLALPQKETFIFLFIGRLLYDKGLGEFVEAARQLKQLAPHAECWVIGGLNTKNPAAVSKKQMLEWVEAQDILYFGEAEDVRKYIKKAKAIVLPSYREGIPRSILEAMAMAKPVITTNTAGCRETVEHGKNGSIVPVKDSKALAESMLNIYHQSPLDLLKMGQYSREKALAEFDDKIVTEKFLSLIIKLLKPKKSIRNWKEREREIPQHISI
ncbi:MAG: glycosyl transferase [Saprospiraceae bacterium]|nr:MAG: glycosyl transferase [Saprospiraceae bacterium]